ncbi:TPA: hypothetical protein RJ953_000001 [Enterobacter hormaechei]|uniref:hypothetical protein n=1 Tax=Enterobacter hormaechei TaxID=158836 RepID=UPI002862D16E|nr:hypothetical protein [Enterobacter hormaechei]
MKHIISIALSLASCSALANEVRTCDMTLYHQIEGEMLEKYNLKQNTTVIDKGNSFVISSGISLEEKSPALDKTADNGTILSEETKGTTWTSFAKGKDETGYFYVYKNNVNKSMKTTVWLFDNCR